MYSLESQCDLVERVGRKESFVTSFVSYFETGTSVLSCPKQIIHIMQAYPVCATRKMEQGVLCQKCLLVME